MRRWPGILALALGLAAAQAEAAALPRRLRPPSLVEQMLAGGPIPPGGTLIVSGAASGSRLRTLELDDLAPARLRLTIPF